jgi:hypothetical protein
MPMAAVKNGCEAHHKEVSSVRFWPTCFCIMRSTYGCRGIGQGFGLSGMQMTWYVTAILNCKLRHFGKVYENVSKLAA